MAHIVMSYTIGCGLWAWPIFSCKNWGGGLPWVAASLPQWKDPPHPIRLSGGFIDVSGASSRHAQRHSRHGSVDQSTVVIRTGEPHMMDWLHMVEWTHTFAVLGVFAS